MSQKFFTPYTFCPEYKLPVVWETQLKALVNDKRDIKVPKHFYMRALASLSLSLKEKHRIFENLPHLKQLAIDELDKVFREEVEQFQSLFETEESHIVGLINHNFCQILILGKLYQMFDQSAEDELIKSVLRPWLSKRKKHAGYVLRFPDATPYDQYIIEKYIDTYEDADDDD